jgi:hypothetical protein
MAESDPRIQPDRRIQIPAQVSIRGGAPPLARPPASGSLLRRDRQPQMSRMPPNDASPGPPRRSVVGVIGSSEVAGEAARQAQAMGRVICRAGAHLVCGGLGGTMHEACRGFVEQRHELGRERCGVTIGMLPGMFRTDANPYVDVIVPTNMGIMRNVLVVQTADVLVSVSGGSGTLSELAAGWQQGKTLIALSSTGGWSAELAGRLIDGRRPDAVIDAPTVEEAERRLLRLIGKKTA